MTGCIVGWAHTPFGRLDGETVESLVVKAANGALKDAGVEAKDVDEIILAHLIRTRTTNPWKTAEEGLILYAQNYKHFLKNAAWLSVFLWVLTILIFVVIVGPFAAIAAARIDYGDLTALLYAQGYRRDEFVES